MRSLGHNSIDALDDLSIDTLDTLSLDALDALSILSVVLQNEEQQRCDTCEPRKSVNKFVPRKQKSFQVLITRHKTLYVHKLLATQEVILSPLHHQCASLSKHALVMIQDFRNI